MKRTTTGCVELPVIGAPVSGGGHCIEIELIEHGANECAGFYKVFGSICSSLGSEMGFTLV